jgi:hypothetical protein
MPSSIGMPVLNMLKILTPKDITRLSKQVKKIEKVQLTKIMTEEMNLQKHHEEDRLKQKLELEKKKGKDEKIEPAGTQDKKKQEQEELNTEEMLATRLISEEELGKVEEAEKEEKKEKKKKSHLIGQEDEEKELTEQEKALLEMSSTNFFLNEKEKGREVEKKSKKAGIIRSYKELAQMDIPKEDKDGDISKIGQTGILFNKKRF